MTESGGKSKRTQKQHVLRFDRRISDAFEKAILESSDFISLIRNPGTLCGRGSSLPVEFDAQLRLGDVVSICAGLTKPIEFKRKTNGSITVRASKTYKKQAEEGVFGDLPPECLTRQVSAWRMFLDSVEIDDRWVAEGIWQSWLLEQTLREVDAPWAVLDREAQPEGVGPEVQAWLADLRRPWQVAASNALPKRKTKFAGEDSGASPDFIAVTPTGDLAIVEVKHGTNARGIYYGPIQVGGYAELWKRLLKEAPGTVAALNELAEQKKRLGILPAAFPRVRERPACIPVLVVGGPQHRSEVWGQRGLLDVALRSARSAGAPLEALRVYVIDGDGTDLELVDVTESLTP